MAEVMNLIDLPTGQLGEIVELAAEHQHDIFQQYGADKGMSVVVLNKAVDWLVQIGYNQVFMAKEHLHRIKVRTV